MTKIGLLSDTHGYLDPKVFEYFKDVDEVWHAGDIGSLEIVDQLKKFIKEDVFITNDEYKKQIESPNGLIINDTMFFNTGNPILDVKEPAKVEYVIHNFDRVIVELLNQASYMQSAIENLYIDEEVTELGVHLGYEPNLNNVLRIIANNMQTFFFLRTLHFKCIKLLLC